MILYLGIELIYFHVTPDQHDEQSDFQQAPRGQRMGLGDPRG